MTHTKKHMPRKLADQAFFKSMSSRRSDWNSIPNVCVFIQLMTYITQNSLWENFKKWYLFKV